MRVSQNEALHSVEKSRIGGRKQVALVVESLQRVVRHEITDEDSIAVGPLPICSQDPLILVVNGRNSVQHLAAGISRDGKQRKVLQSDRIHFAWQQNVICGH